MTESRTAGMRILSYNLRKHRAAHELADLAERNRLDVLCLQEAEAAQLPMRVGHLRLAHATANNRLGLAVYVCSDRFEVTQSRTFELKASLHDRLFAPANERLVGVRLTDLAHDRSLIAASFHAAPLTALNALRRHQIRTAHRSLATLGDGVPQLMVGDFNYPVFQRKLVTHLCAAGYELSRSDRRTYTRYGVIRGHFDFATSMGFDVRGVRTLARGMSDHLPILVDAEYRDNNATLRTVTVDGLDLAAADRAPALA